MAIIIDTPTIHKSLAQLVLSITPNACVYDNPNQQGTTLPAWFIVHREPVDIKEDLHGRWWLNYHIDLFYMLDFNCPHLFDDYSAIADRLGELGEYLPIYGHENVVIHAFERSWGMYMDALKCSMTFKIRVTRDLTPPVYMEVIEDLSVFLKNQKVEFCTLSFTNDEHPDFSVDLPDDIIASVDSFVKLPSVSGEHEEGGELWVPNEWDIGAFGQPVKMSNDITANLLWAIKPQYTLSFENTDHPQFDVELPDPITDYQGEEITLPTVAHQEFEDDGYVYWPLQWDIGAFGSKYVLNQDTDANLLWQSLKLVTITFANPDHPSFAIDLPLPITVRPGESVTLPSVTGEWTEGGITYTPSQWDIGAFGDSYTPDADTVANLMFNEAQQYTEITLYGNVSSDISCQNNVTSGFTGNVNTANVLQLYTDNTYTTPWNGYDYSNDYKMGVYSSSGVWYPRGGTIADLPDTTANPGNGETVSKLFVLLDTGCLWFVCNNSNSSWGYNNKHADFYGTITLRIYPKAKQHHALYFNTSSVYNNISMAYNTAYDMNGSPGTGSHPIPLTSNFPDKSIVGVYGSAGNLVSSGYKNFSWVGSTKLRVGYYNTDAGTLSARLLLFTTDQYIDIAYINTSGNTSVSSGSAKRLYSKDGYYLAYFPSLFTYTPLALFKYDGSCADDSSGHYINKTTLGNYTGPSDVLCLKQTYGTISFSYIWFLRTPISQK